MGHAWPPHRRERASSPRWVGPHCRSPQRHHRELPRDQARARRRRTQVRVRDRHRSGRAPGPEGMAQRRAGERGAARHEAGARFVCAGAALGRRPEEARDSPQRSANRGRYWRRRVLRRVRCTGDPEPHPRCGVHGRPRNGCADTGRRGVHDTRGKGRRAPAEPCHVGSDFG